MLDVHRLRVFRSVVASGSIQAAAVNLGYTASAVSQHVAALQRGTGLSLVTRSGGASSRPRPGWRSPRRSTACWPGSATSRRLWTICGPAGPDAVHPALLRLGRLGLDARCGTRSAARVPRSPADLALRDDLPAPGRERADIQVDVERARRAARGARAHHLLDDPYVAVMSRDHPLAGAAVIELAELAGDAGSTTTSHRGWCRRNLLEACQAAGFSPAFQVEAHDYPTAIAFVDAGIGLTVLPRLGARHLPAGVVAVPVTAPPAALDLRAGADRRRGRARGADGLAVLRQCAAAEAKGLRA